MKKSVTVASILLSGLLSFSLSAFAQDIRTTMLPQEFSKHHASHQLAHINKSEKDEWFNQ